MPNSSDGSGELRAGGKRDRWLAFPAAETKGAAASKGLIEVSDRAAFMSCRAGPRMNRNRCASSIRSSSMERDFIPLLSRSLTGWRMAGPGGFSPCDDGVIESHGGSGIFWYADAAFDDFALRVAWRLTRSDDNSGVFLRIPPLESDPQPAVDHGYEVQIDDRGFDPQAGRLDSALHLTGAIYRLAPATRRASRPLGSWNAFGITALGTTISVRLNDVPVTRLEGAARRRCGHVGLQAHHEGSAVQFRDLSVRRL